MKKIFFCLIVLLWTNCLMSQEKKEITNAEGIYVSYKLIKTDSSSNKKDKYLLKVYIENINEYDVAYLVRNTDNTTNLNYAAVSEIIVANIVNLFGQSITENYYVAGRQSNLKTSDFNYVFILQKGHPIRKEFKLVTKKGINPVVTGSIKERFYKLESLY